MVKLRHFIFFILLAFSPQGIASSENNPSGIDEFCMLLEGIPLPFCQFTRYHTCKSGSAQPCQYAQTGRIIEKIDDPATGTCAQNATVCTTTERCTPDGCTTSVNCQCRDPKPTVTQCRTACFKCILPDSITIDFKVTCPHHCGDPDTCPSTWNRGGKTYELIGPNMHRCGPDLLCADGGKPGDPTDVNRDCPIYPPPQPNTPNMNGCCYQGGSSEGNFFNLPAC